MNLFALSIILPRNLNNINNTSLLIILTTGYTIGSETLIFFVVGPLNFMRLEL
jgi:hypothetical protein